MHRLNCSPRDLTVEASHRSVIERIAGDGGGRHGKEDRGYHADEPADALLRKRRLRLETIQLLNFSTFQYGNVLPNT